VCSAISGRSSHLEQLRLVGMESCEQAVEGDEARSQAFLMRKRARTSSPISCRR
jgi:hypothetical protein